MPSIIFYALGIWASTQENQTLLYALQIKALQACNIPSYRIFSMQKILKLDLFMQNLKKIGKEMPKIESEKTIYNVNQGPYLCT